MSVEKKQIKTENTSHIFVRKYKKGDDIKKIAELIYDTDPYIYPAAFGEKKDLGDNLIKLIEAGNGLYDGEHIIIAVLDNKIAGVALSLEEGDSTKIPLENIRTAHSFSHVYKHYFSHIDDILSQGTVYVTCFSVDRYCQKQGVGTALMQYILNHNHSKKLQLGVLSDNINAISLYEKFGFKIVGGMKKGYCFSGETPNCYNMEYNAISGED